MICCAAVTSGPMPGENKHPRARKMRMCHGCEKQFIPTGPWKCSCRLAHYCGTACQKAHWAVQKLICDRGSLRVTISRRVGPTATLASKMSAAPWRERGVVAGCVDAGAYSVVAGCVDAGPYAVDAGRIDAGAYSVVAVCVDAGTYSVVAGCVDAGAYSVVAGCIDACAYSSAIHHVLTINRRPLR